MNMINSHRPYGKVKEIMNFEIKDIASRNRWYLWLSRICRWKEWKKTVYRRRTQ